MRNNEVYRTPEFRKKMRLIGVERQKRLWNDPVYRSKQTENLKASKHIYSFKMNQSIAQLKRFTNPKEIEKLRIAHKNQKNFAKGEKAGGWHGGVSTENERHRKCVQFRLWREAVFARDNWRCQNCGLRGGKLHPHHIRSFSKFKDLRFSIDNGLTLCVECHKKMHQKKDDDHFEGA